MLEVAGDLMGEVYRWRDVDRVDVDLQQRNVIDPGLVLDLDRVVAEPDDQVGRAQEPALDLPAASLDAAERQRVILIDHALGHGGGGERQVVALDELAQQVGVGNPHRRRADHRDGALGGGQQFTRPRDGCIRRGGDPAGADRHRRHRLVGRRERHVFGQIEMHRPLRFAQRQPDRFAQGLGDAALFEPQRRLGDRVEQRMVVDPHLDAPAKLIGVEVAGDGDHRRAVEKRAADAGRQVGCAGPEGCDAEARCAGHAAGDVGGEAGRSLVRGQHELDAAVAHRLHQRQHIAARNAESAIDTRRLQGRNDQVGIVHRSAS